MNKKWRGPFPRPKPFSPLSDSPPYVSLFEARKLALRPPRTSLRDALSGTWRGKGCDRKVLDYKIVLPSSPTPGEAKAGTATGRQRDFLLAGCVSCVGCFCNCFDVSCVLLIVCGRSLYWLCVGVVCLCGVNVMSCVGNGA